MNLGDVRDKLAALLAPVEDDDPNVLSNLVDSIEPPALMLGWADPWILPEGMCFGSAHVLVTAVAARLAPGEGIAKLEELVLYTLHKVRPSKDFALVEISGPHVFLIAQTNYLASRIMLRVSIDE